MLPILYFIRSYFTDSQLTYTCTYLLVVTLTIGPLGSKLVVTLLTKSLFLVPNGLHLMC